MAQMGTEREYRLISEFFCDIRGQPDLLSRIRKRAQYSMSNFSILIVDDELNVRSSIGRNLKMEGYHVVLAKSGEEAFEKIAQEPFGLVITDLMMGIIGGIEVLEGVKKRSPKTAVMILTGYASVSSAVDALRLGADDYLLKPCDRHELSIRVANCFKKVELERSLQEKTRELLASKAHYATLAEISPVGIFRARNNGDYFYVNKKWLEISGVALEKAHGTGWMDNIFPEDKERVAHAWNLAIKTRCPFKSEFRFQRNNGETVWVFEQAVPENEESDMAWGFVGTITDITERILAEVQLRLSHDSLEDRIKQRTVELENKNIALHEILGRIEVEKRQVKDAIKANSEELLLPLLRKIKNKKGRIDLRILDLLKKNIEVLTSGFGVKVSDKKLRLTPREIEVCSMIKTGFGSKEISEMLNISLGTIENHRRNIRHKLNIANKSINLTTYLQEL